MAIVVDWEIKTLKQIKKEEKAKTKIKTKDNSWQKVFYIEDRTNHLYNWVITKDFWDIMEVELICAHYTKKWEKLLIKLPRDKLHFNNK